VLDVAITNEHGQSISEDLGTWRPPKMPRHETLTGQTVRLEPLERGRHAIPLFHTFRHSDESMWTYMSHGPFHDAAELGQLIDAMIRNPDGLAYAVIVDDEVHGILSLLRIQPDVGVLEIGWIAFSPMIQRSTATTETIALLLRHVFDAGYRRVEWKCDALNDASRNAEERLGFQYEGTFRKATHYKGRNRDTAWFALLDDDWPTVGQGFAKWLSPENFDDEGIQRTRLGHS